MKSGIRKIILLISFLMIALGPVYSQSILSLRTYPYITLDEKDSVIVVITLPQYDALAHLIVEHKYQDLELLTMDTLMQTFEVNIQTCKEKELLYNQRLIDKDVKYNAQSDIIRITKSDNSNLISRNLLLNEENRKLYKSRNNWRAFGIVGTLAVLVKIGMSLNK